MNLQEKLQYFKNKGYTYDPETGIIINNFGELINNKSSHGYIRVRYNKIHTYAHQFAWYMYYNEIPKLIDHINRDKTDNKISNLRKSTKQQNSFNNNAKGYYYNKKSKKYESSIGYNYKKIHLGYFNTSEEARQAYLDAKKIYHTFKMVF